MSNVDIGNMGGYDSEFIARSIANEVAKKLGITLNWTSQQNNRPAWVKKLEAKLK